MYGKRNIKCCNLPVFSQYHSEERKKITCWRNQSKHLIFLSCFFVLLLIICLWCKAWLIKENNCETFFLPFCRKQKLSVFCQKRNNDKLAIIWHKICQHYFWKEFFNKISCLKKYYLYHECNTLTAEIILHTITNVACIYFVNEHFILSNCFMKYSILVESILLSTCCSTA